MFRMNNFILLRGTGLFSSIICLVMLFGNACTRNNTNELYYKLPDRAWARFNLLRFEIPVNEVEKSWDVILFARFTPDYQYRTLDFNMILNTATGEERINEYQMPVKSAEGTFLFNCASDSCEGVVLLKRQLYLSKAGILKIEIENLTPRLVTEGVIGVGVRLVESGK